MLGIRQLDHLVLRVSNLQAMMHFYIDVLGCTWRRSRRISGSGSCAQGRR